MNNNIYIVSDMTTDDFYFCDSRKTAKEIAIRLLFRRKGELFKQYTTEIYDRLSNEKAYFTEFETFYNFVMGIVENEDILCDYEIVINQSENFNIITLNDIDKIIGKNY